MQGFREPVWTAECSRHLGFQTVPMDLTTKVPRQKLLFCSLLFLMEADPPVVWQQAALATMWKTTGPERPSQGRLWQR